MKPHINSRILAALLGVVCAVELPGQTPDTTPPELLCPRLILTPCETTNGATVFFSIIAVDDQDTNVTVTCMPPSGSTFPIGTNLVMCSAEDDATNISTCAFEVVVTGDCTPDPCLSIQCPPNILTNCTMSGGTPVSFTVEATNQCTGGVTVTCDPPSGSPFPPGITTVLCRADPPRGEPVFCSFTVEVLDEVAPTINCPTNLLVEAQSLAGAIVSWAVTATDNCDTNVAVYCDPPAGSVFPLGTTPVYCWAQDGSGNKDVCGFTVTVTNSWPFAITHTGPLAGPSVILNWRGNNFPQEAPSLNPPMDWQTVVGTIVTNGSERTMQLPATGAQRYFRLGAFPAPPPDTDGDGVPDPQDRCPETPPGLLVNTQGCALVELATDPRRAAERTLLLLPKAMVEIQRDVLFRPVSSALEQHLAELLEAESLIREGQITNGVDLFEQAVSGVETQQIVFEGIVAQWNATRQPWPVPPGEEADTTEEGAVAEQYDWLTGLLQDAASEARVSAMAFAALKSSITGQSTTSGTITNYNDAKRLIQLDTGQTLGLSHKIYAASVTEGSPVDVTVLGLADGTGMTVDLQGGSLAPPFGLDVIPVKCLHLRVAPVQRFPPFSGGPFTLHSPAAYDNGGELWLEQGMRLGVLGTCPSIIITTNNTRLNYRMVLQLAYQSTTLAAKQVTLAGNLSPDSTPVRLPADMHTNLPAKLTVSIIRFECPPPEVFGFCSKPEVLSVEDFTIRVRARNAYASVDYDQTQFDLEDKPFPHNLNFRTNSTEAPALILPQPGVGPLNFEGEGLRVIAGQSSFPNVQPVGEGQDFAVYSFDFVDFSQDDALARWGLESRSALIWPRVTAKRNGYSLAYSCALPALVRDVVAFCPGPPHTFYRLPFHESDPNNWRQGKGNGPGPDGHSGTAVLYAFDMTGVPVNTTIHAVRGGVVEYVQESYSLNSYDPIQDTCTNQNHNVLRIRHQDGTMARYVHMPQNGVFVVPGQRVYRGDAVGLVGNTGCSDGPHLHFEVREFSNANSIPIRFEAWSTCTNQANEIYRCFPIQECYVPVKGDRLFSTNKRWWE